MSKIERSINSFNICCKLDIGMKNRSYRPMVNGFYNRYQLYQIEGEKVNQFGVKLYEIICQLNTFNGYDVRTRID